MEDAQRRGKTEWKGVVIFKAVTVIVNELLQEGYEMKVYEPCSFRNFAKNSEPGVLGDTIARDSSVGTVLVEVNDHLMGRPGLAHHDSLERLRGYIDLG